VLQFDHPADPVLRVNDVIPNIEGVRLDCHLSSFRSARPQVAVAAIN
jgi:hypothetical protein